MHEAGSASSSPNTLIRWAQKHLHSYSGDCAALSCRYPERMTKPCFALSKSENICDVVEAHSELRHVTISVQYELHTSPLTSQIKAISLNASVVTLVGDILSQAITKLNVNLDKEWHVLKVLGREEYLITETAISNFVYVQECIRFDEPVQLVLVHTDVSKAQFSEAFGEREDLKNSLIEYEDWGDVYCSPDSLAPGCVLTDQLRTPVRVCIQSVENVLTSPNGAELSSVRVEACLACNGIEVPDTRITTQFRALQAMHAADEGGTALVQDLDAPTRAPAAGSSPTAGYASAHWPMDFTVTDCDICDLQEGSRFIFRLVGKTCEGKQLCLASACLPLFTEQRTLTSGSWSVVMHTHSSESGEVGISEDTTPAHATYTDDPCAFAAGPTIRYLSEQLLCGPCWEPTDASNAPVLSIELDTFPATPVLTLPQFAAVQTAVLDNAIALNDSQEHTQLQFSDSEEYAALTAFERELLHSVLQRDLLSLRAGLSEPERQVVQKCATYLQLNPHFTSLTLFLRSVDVHTPNVSAHNRSRVLAFLCAWHRVTPPQALQLLDAVHADVHVRAFAVGVLNALGDHELVRYMQQLAQALKLESFTDSILARMLLKRATAAPTTVGHALFWALKSEVHLISVRSRFSYLLMVLLSIIPSYTSQLRTQSLLNDMFIAVCTETQRQPKAERSDFARAALDKACASLPASFTLPLGATFKCSGIRVESCKVMSSKKAPVWCVFRNADPLANDIVAIFKCGDDLRQDIWEAEDLFLRMKVYECICTGPDAGMIEVVTHSDTIARIQTRYGGRIKGAFIASSIQGYIEEHNEGTQLQVATQHFLETCVGYSVATHVLGIGDRHPSNILLTEHGFLFHIDFGHFLGNFKEKEIAGVRIKRERATFVLTKQMAYVMGGEQSNSFKQFERMCLSAYVLLRQHAHIFLSMLILLLQAGLPELQTAEDIRYTVDRLCLSVSEEEAAVQFSADLTNALSAMSRHIDNMVHQSVHC